jgi:hypothetical protein
MEYTHHSSLLQVFRYNKMRFDLARSGGRGIGMMTEDPLQAGRGIVLDQQDLRVAALHADLMRGVDGAVQRRLLTGEDIECNSMERHGPFQTAAENMEIVAGLSHPGALSHIFDRHTDPWHGSDVDLDNSQVI